MLVQTTERKQSILKDISTTLALKLLKIILMMKQDERT